jgi:hypothetical protein
MNTEQAYINGFVKRASECGYSEQEAVEIYKEADIRQFGRNLFAGIIKKPRRTGGAIAGVAGAGLGGAAGGVIGGVHNLINPGTEVDEETGETVDRNRLKAILMGSLKGLGIGAGIGGGIGAGLGAYRGNQVQNAMKIDPQYRRDWRAEGVDIVNSSVLSKRASEHGFNQTEAIELYKQAFGEKDGPYRQEQAAQMMADEQILKAIAHNKEKHKGHYYFNPLVAGPVRELYNRLSRRFHAASAGYHGGLINAAFAGGLGPIPSIVMGDDKRKAIARRLFEEHANKHSPE